MPFYSRHSSDGRDRFLGYIQDEKEYDQFMKMIFLSVATLQMKYKVIMTVQKQMSYRPQAVKKKRLKKQGNTKKNITVSTTKKRCKNHTCVEFVEKLFPTAQISEDTKNLKDVQKQKPMFSEISYLLVIFDLIKTNYI